jgi:hypothetical protein
VAGCKASNIKSFMQGTQSDGLMAVIQDIPNLLSNYDPEYGELQFQSNRIDI